MSDRIGTTELPAGRLLLGDPGPEPSEDRLLEVRELAGEAKPWHPERGRAVTRIPNCGRGLSPPVK